MEKSSNPAGIPSSEKIWSKIVLLSGQIFFITSKQNDRSVYYLYELRNGKAVRIDKDSNPRIMEERIIKNERTKEK